MGGLPWGGVVEKCRAISIAWSRKGHVYGVAYWLGDLEYCRVLDDSAKTRFLLGQLMTSLALKHPVNNSAA